MNKTRTIYLWSIFLLLQMPLRGQSLAPYVNPFIGTANFGTTHPGALAPQGMVSVVPFNVSGSADNRWDKDKRWWSAPYSSDNVFFTGFSHVNLSGVGCPELGVILLMPTSGALTAVSAQYGSPMSRQEASPGYYACFLDKYKIKAEATASKRGGFSRFTFPQGQSNVLIDLAAGLTNETGGCVRIVNDREVEGWRMSGNFCYHANAERPVYFVARFSRAAEKYGVWKKMPPMQAEAVWSASAGKFNYYDQSLVPMAGDSVGAYFSFTTDEGEVISVQLGVSYVSVENARHNLEVEQGNNDFEAVYGATLREWEQRLGVVRVRGGTDEQKTVFYTALYHLHFHPNIFNDVNGDYPMMESEGTGKVRGCKRYTVFSLWDTYRNYHPLMTLLYPDLQLDFVRSMVDMYEESGWLPKWELNGRETYTMNGDPAFCVIADTYLRGLTDFDVQQAYRAMIKHATTPGKENKIRTENDFYLENAYVPLRKAFDNSTSVALELYVADWNLSRLSEALGEKENARRYKKQSLAYVNYFDKKDFKMLRPKLADGRFLTPFDPMQGADFEPVNGFHEGTAWQYAFAVPHDIPGLIKLMGGEQQFVAALQNVFDKGLFDMANEPDIHYPFLFNYVKGEEWRAQKETRRLLNTFFKNTPAGLPGNDDCGTMSAWAVLAMMGLYPACPGDMNYAVVQPVFDEIEIQLDTAFYNKGLLRIAKEVSKENGYVKSIELGGKRKKQFFVNHSELLEAGELNLVVE